MKIFNTVKVRKPKYSSFDLSHEKKMSFNMGQLIPAFLQDVVPGDRFKVNTETLMRLAPMLAPIMHRVNVYMHYFFVPNRLVFNEWENFITGGEDGTEAPTFPTLYFGNMNGNMHRKGSLSDFLGAPVYNDEAVTNKVYISALPFRGYQMIYNEYYRDQNLEEKVEFAIGGSTSGDEAAIMALRNRCWEKDYFTSCLPFAQRGSPVTMPIDGEIDFQPDYKNPALLVSGANGNIQSTSGQIRDSGNTARVVDNLNQKTYDLEGSTVTINQLRLALRLQQWMENNARGGSRYIEQILHHFGVVSDDARLQRPEYLGGSKNPIVISEVLSSVGNEDAPQGNMSGHGISVGASSRFDRYFKEHGYIFGIMSVLPRTAYQQGIEKHLLKTDKFDFYFPEFANLGEQEVQNQEIYWNYANGSNPTSTFGYQSRYAEYKHKMSKVHGDFIDDLSYWHMGRIFSTQPALNSAFVHADPTHRIFNVTDTDVHKLYVQMYHRVNALRPMPYIGIPTI